MNLEETYYDQGRAHHENQRDSQAKEVRRAGEVVRGFPSGAPNEKLLNACGAYLDALDNGQPTQEAAAGLVAQLETTANSKPTIADVNNILNNLDSIKEILEHKNLL